MTRPAPAVVRLPWDSDYFGIEVGRLNDAVPTERTAEALTAGDAAGIVCTYLLVPGGDFAVLGTAQELGFRVVDVRTELARALDAADEDAARAVSFEVVGGAEETGWIAELAGRRFAHSRFTADRRFSRAAVDGLFRRWVTRGFADPDAEILALSDERGFVIVSQRDGRGSIDLIATTEAAPRGTGTELLHAAHARLAGAGCHAVDVVTQGTNVPALRLYERAGYRVTASSYWLHRWRSEHPARPPQDR